jgi:ribonuclease D
VFDTEFVMEDRFEAEVCLIQIATEAMVGVIDPFLDLDLSAVWALVCDDEVETVVHAGQEDLAHCVRQTGQPPRRVYDVQIAAGFAGYDYPLSLQKLVQTTLHVRLHKSKTLTDWRRRPLTPEQIRYGAEDVSYLLAVRRKLQERLSRRNRLAWVLEEFARFEDISFYRRAEEEKLLRVKGSGALKGRQLAVVRELLAWREELAKRRNRPVRIVLKDHLLVEIAKLELHSFREVRDLRGLNLSDRDVRGLCRVVQEALGTPSEQWPVLAPRDTETPRETALIALISAVVRSYGLENDIAYGLLASKRSIRELVRHCARSRRTPETDVELLNGWRGQAIGVMLKAILAGKESVQVLPSKGEPIIRTTPVDNEIVPREEL